MTYWKDKLHKGGNKVAEIWDLYDINRNKLGRLHERGIPLNNGEYHLVVDIWVIDSNKQILLTQRHPDKQWGNYWECTGGSVVAGEDSVSGAKRELLEEIGIEIADNQIVLLGTSANRDWITDTYLVKLDISICELGLQPGEVIDAKWVDISEFEDMCSKKLIVPSVSNRFKSYMDKMGLR